MNKEEFIDFLKQSLSIKIEEDYESFIGSGIRVTLMLNEEVISSDFVVTEYS